MRASTLLSMIIGAFVGLIPAIPAQARPLDPHVAALLDVTRLAERRDGLKVGGVSSYDPAGTNDDGFSGKTTCLRLERGECVIVDLKGPGALTRVQVPDGFSTDATVSFFIDGEVRPRLSLPIVSLFDGSHPAFQRPLADHGVGGGVSYMPIAFAKSIKMTVKASRFRFYTINYALFPKAQHITSFNPDTVASFVDEAPAGAERTTSGILTPGGRLTIFHQDRPGRIEKIRIGPVSALGGNDRGLILRAYWDGSETPAIEVPVGDFLGFYFGRPSARSRLMGADDQWAYLSLPMPFARSARIELVSECADGPAIQVRSIITASDRGKTAKEGYFHALWRRENPTRVGHPFSYIDVAGRGQLVGVALQTQGFEPGNTAYFEGDDEAIIDGQMAVHGPGTEDSFNGGFYAVPGRWNGHRSLHFSGALGYDIHLGRTGGFRLMISDALSFQRHLQYTVEHGAVGNSVPTDYSATAYYYLDRPERQVASLVPLSERRVEPVKGFELSFLPSPPKIDSLLFTSVKTSMIHGEKAGFSFDIDVLLGKDPPDYFRDWGAPHVALIVDAPAAGSYDLFIEGLTGPQAAALEIVMDDRAVGKAVDFRAKDVKRTDLIKIGTAQMRAGENILYLTIPQDSPLDATATIRLTRLMGLRKH